MPLAYSCSDYIMPNKLQRRIDKALDLIAAAVRLAHRIALVCIVAVAILLSFVAWYLYSPFIVVIAFVAVGAAWYVTAKKDEIAEIIEDADEQSGLPQDESGPHRSRLSSMPRRIVDKVVDQAMSTVVETALLGPVGGAILAAGAFVMGYNGFGWIVGIVSLTLFLLIFCAQSMVKHIANQWVETLFGQSEEHSQSEKSPLLR